ncbi:peptidase domain-containing ABC transporter [Piscinibacterium candidicorallinum]|uniref:Peptidase domain-containing ABC transporter n=1 Tax=Piscinibacterium candidicorallinum TaxID=1793872 RepID=A0ABV7HBV9_9BURK
MRPHLQSTAAECSIACLAMVADHFGLRMDLADLRRRFSLSLKGATLAQLMRYAAELNFTTRPLRLELEELHELQTPCILHWDLNHFVVLKRVRGRGVTARVEILDPAVGGRTLSLGEVSKHFTGVALELAPGANFQRADERRRIRLRDLTGHIFGLRRALLVILALALALEGIGLLVPMTTQWVIDEAIVSGDTHLLIVIVLGAGILALTDFALRTARGWISLRLSMDVGLQWTANVFAHLTRLPVSYFEQRHLGDITSRFGSLDAIKHVLTTGAVEAVLDGLMLFATLGLMLMYSWQLTLIAAAALLLYGLLRWASYRPFRDANEERIVLGAKESSHFMETIRAVTPLKLFGRETERLARWQNLAVDVQNRDLRTAKMELLFGTGNTLIFGVESALLLLIGGLAVIANELTVGMLMAFMAYKANFARRATALIDLAVQIKMLGLHAERLADIALEKPEAPVPAETDLTRIQPSIELMNVKFRYGEGEPWVLDGVSLKIEAGENLAIVGPSGCGKSTLLKIMLGLHQPQEGEVRVGGIPVRQLGLAQFRQLVGTVMQDDVLLAGSLAENIAFFDTHPKQERIEAAAQLAAIHTDIAAMPMGYQTLVGDMGSSLSGGQKQRVLLARALYKGPKILALDEATSHLDVDSERAVNAAIKNMRLTRITIAHRPETIANARRIVALAGGRVVRDMAVATGAVTPSAGTGKLHAVQP